jgi:hypothetical protein
MRDKAMGVHREPLLTSFYVTTQVVRSQNSGVRMKDLAELRPLPEEVSKLLDAHLQAILDSDF